MKEEEFLKKVEESVPQIEQLISRKLPVMAGRTAKDHFQENFDKSGFVDGGLNPWKPSKRIGHTKGANGSNKTLLSGRNHLYSSINYVPGDAEVSIQDRVPYAAVHNEGLHAGRGKGFEMPRRQFIGKSRELDEKIEKLIEQELEKILKI